MEKSHERFTDDQTAVQPRKASIGGAILDEQDLSRHGLHFSTPGSDPGEPLEPLLPRAGLHQVKPSPSGLFFMRIA